MFDEVPVVLRNAGLDDLVPMVQHARVRPFLIVAHVPAIAHGVAAKNSGQPAGDELWDLSS
jgi:hypothetical protein